MSQIQVYVQPALTMNKYKFLYLDILYSVLFGTRTANIQVPVGVVRLSFLELVIVSSRLRGIPSRSRETANVLCLHKYYQLQVDNYGRLHRSYHSRQGSTLVLRREPGASTSSKRSRYSTWYCVL